MTPNPLNGGAAMREEREKLDGSNSYDEVEAGSESTAESWEDEDSGLHYKIDETPPFYLCLLLGFQHYISMFIATLTVPFLLAPAICMGDDHVGKSEITGTLFVASGLITLLQTAIGCRLPVVQAGTFALLVPTLAYLRLEQWTCPTNIVGEIPLNATDNSSYILVGSEEHREVWMTRLREAVLGCYLGLYPGHLGVLSKVPGCFRNETTMILSLTNFIIFFDLTGTLANGYVLCFVSLIWYLVGEVCLVSLDRSLYIYGEMEVRYRLAISSGLGQLGRI